MKWIPTIKGKYVPNTRNNHLLKNYCFLEQKGFRSTNLESRVLEKKYNFQRNESLDVENK